jgi:epoxyqueuosine reductase QueG
MISYTNATKVIILIVPFKQKKKKNKKKKKQKQKQNLYEISRIQIGLDSHGFNPPSYDK